MFKKRASEALGLSDIGAIVPSRKIAVKGLGVTGQMLKLGQEVSEEAVSHHHVSLLNTLNGVVLDKFSCKVRRDVWAVYLESTAVLLEVKPQMRTLLGLVCAVLITACASKPSGPAQTPPISTVPSTPSHDIPDGVWQGRIDWSGFQADGTPSSGSYGLLIAACKGTASVWAQDQEKPNRYSAISLHMAIRSEADTHVLSFINAARKQPDWVEIHTYSLLEVTADNARVQWTRAVNNRDLDPSHGNRTFFHHGTGEFKRTQTTCDPRLFESDKR
ncbi:MAG: hypothetical protein EOP35_14230 [Rubrivivax sp.]|nr:MAG: hypothetical protein EOP35_14230 [Rubrivivax sp.]